MSCSRRGVRSPSSRSRIRTKDGGMMTRLAGSGVQVSAKRRGYRLTAGVLLVLMLGGTLPVPLYVLYERQMGFGPLGVTVVFAAYVAGTLVALVALGDLSDHIGRKKVLAVAVACAAASTALFLVASGIGVLVAARVVSGVAAGFATGTATAALAELQPRGDHRAAAVVASGSNMTGLGLGPLTAGLFAEYVAMPTRSVFWAYLGRPSVSTGLPLLLVCLAALEAALFGQALWLFVVATIAGGIAVGFIFRGGLSELSRLAEPRHRAAVVSAFFVAAYLGLGLPSVLIGLISPPVGPA